MTARTTWTSSLLLVGLCGCLGRGQTDLLQARLREQQQALADVQSQLKSVSNELKLARKESEYLRSRIAQGEAPGLLPEQTDLLVRASAIRINSMLTAGFDRDEAYGDDSLVVNFVPVDDNGEVVRLPGEIEIRVLDPALAEGSQTVAKWTFTATESRDHWVRGLFGAGYQFTLPWPAPPRNSELVVHVQLRPGDGRSFKTSHVVKITPPVVTAEGQTITPAKAERETLKPPQDVPSTRRVDDSSAWMKDDVPVYR